MPLSQRNLSSIYRVGQAVHHATDCLSASVREQARSTVESMVKAPFAAESVKKLDQFQTLTRLNQCLIAFEAELKTLCAIATKTAIPVSNAIIVANVVSAKVAGKTVNASKRRSNSKRNVTKPGRDSANDIQLLAYLRSVLKVGELTSCTCAAMATGSGLPLGSVGISLRNILAGGSVKAGGRGMYQLAAQPNSEVTAKEIASKAIAAMASAPNSEVRETAVHR